jgi:hypothetical protein
MACDAPNVCRGDAYHPIEIERIGNPADCKIQSIAPTRPKIVDHRVTVGRWRQYKDKREMFETLIASERRPLNS